MMNNYRERLEIIMEDYNKIITDMLSDIDKYTFALELISDLGNNFSQGVAKEALRD